MPQHDVRMWSYINTDWDAQPMWQIKHAQGEQWGDSRVQASPTVLKKWRDTVLLSDRFKWAVREGSRGQGRMCVSGGLNVKAPDDDDNVYLIDSIEVSGGEWG